MTARHDDVQATAAYLLLELCDWNVDAARAAIERVIDAKIEIDSRAPESDHNPLRLPSSTRENGQ